MLCLFLLSSNAVVVSSRIMFIQFPIVETGLTNTYKAYEGAVIVTGSVTDLQEKTEPEVGFNIKVILANKKTPKVSV